MGLEAGLNGRIQQGEHDFVVAGQADSPSATGAGGALDHIEVRPVMLDHVHVDGRELVNRISQVAGNGERLEEDLG